MPPFNIENTEGVFELFKQKKVGGALWHQIR